MAANPDTQLGSSIAKIPTFSGSDLSSSAYEMFIFRLRACAGLKGQPFEDVLDLSKDKQGLNGDANKWVFFLLSTSTSEGALRLIDNWRQ